MKKAQASIEFLLTYGWAILVVLLVIGALVYFGVLNPRQFLPTKCKIDGFWCNDYQIIHDNHDPELGSVRISITNENPDPMHILTFNMTADSRMLDCEKGVRVISKEKIPNGDISILTYSGCAIPDAHAGKIKIDISIKYMNLATGFNHTSTGNMLVAVE